MDRDKVINVCKIGQGAECCRYLTAGRGGMECAKNTSLRSALDLRVALGKMLAQGDNCQGEGEDVDR